MPASEQDIKYTHDPPPCWVVHGVDLRRVARLQRGMFWCLLAIAAIVAVVPLAANQAVFGYALGAAWLAFLFAPIVLGGELLGVLNTRVAWMVFAALLFMVPGMNLIVMLYLYFRAKSELERVGLRPGLLGISDARLREHFAVPRCESCGYNLTGNVSGVCAECGSPIAVV